MRHHILALVAAGLIALADPAGAHPDHRSGDPTIDVRVTREGRRIEAVVRTPLDLLMGVGLPLRGERLVDRAAFGKPDPIANDGRSYRDRAVEAVRRAFRIEVDGRGVALEPVTTRLLPGAEDHRQRVAGDPVASSAGEGPVDARTGSLEVRFVGEADRAPMTFVPTLGPAVGSGVVFHLWSRISADIPIAVAGDARPVELMP